MIKVAFVFGLLGSIHCLGMCGPIAFALPLDHKNHLKKTVQLTLYHFGRLVSYSILGGAFGVIGTSFNIFGFQQYLSVFTGILMLLFVIFPKSNFSKISRLKWVQNILFKLQNKLTIKLNPDRKKNFFTIGILNGFLPCGFVYMAILGSLAYSTTVYHNIIFMLFFGIGTTPIMSSVAYAYRLFSKKTQRFFQKQYPLLVIIIAGLFILRGLGLDIPLLSPPSIDFVSSDFSCH